MPGVESLDQFEISRGFKPGELAEFGVRVEAGHVVIPVLGRGGTWHERLRCDMGCHPKYWQEAGLASHLQNPLGLGPHSPEVWIAEGELDTFSLIVAGAPALGVLGADSFNVSWALLFDGAEIVIAFDSDEAGNSRAERLAQLWGGWSDRVSRFDPSPYNDVNEWMVEDRAGFFDAVEDW